mmetsp:Transcript_9685/g.27682  ORF Transcript_9685/g.27682 Transcript_9685/m.27682 type:complete len:234 (-) Transcript_9685:836-1537(-)
MACQPAGSPLERAARLGRPSAAAAPLLLLLLVMGALLDGPGCSCLACFTFSRQSPARGWKLAFSVASPVASCFSRHSSASRMRFFFSASASKSSLSAASCRASASRSACRTACHLSSSELAPLGSFRGFFDLAAADLLSFLVAALPLEEAAGGSEAGAGIGMGSGVLRRGPAVMTGPLLTEETEGVAAGHGWAAGPSWQDIGSAECAAADEGGPGCPEAAVVASCAGVTGPGV